MPEIRSLLATLAPVLVLENEGATASARKPMLKVSLSTKHLTVSLESGVKQILHDVTVQYGLIISNFPM